MARRRLTIGVAGCGPAGMAAALFLHRAGHDVTVFDQMAAPQPIGSGLMLQPTGLAVLRALDLESEIRALGRPIARMLGKLASSGRTVLDVAYDPYGKGLQGLAVHRAALFGVLHRALQARNIEIATSRRIIDVARESGDRVFLIDDKGLRAGPFDLVVDALGLRSPLATDDRRAAQARNLSFGALWTTSPWIAGAFRDDQLEQRYDRAKVMIGVLPVGRRERGGEELTTLFWSLKPADYDVWLKNGLARWKDQALAVWPATEPLLAHIHDPAQMALATYAHFTLPYPAATALVRIGDSAHATSPQLGQGANMALIDAFMLADSLGRENDLDKALRLYVRRRGLHVRLYQAMSHVLTPLYQSDSALPPWLRDQILWPLSQAPPLPTLLSWVAQGRLIDPFRGCGATPTD